MSSQNMTASTSEIPQSQPITTSISTTSDDSQPPEKRGIDIHKALSILSARSTSSHDHHHHNHQNHGQVTTTSGSASSSSNHACSGGCHGDPIPDNVEGMGQTIDMLATKSDGGDNSESLKEKEQEEKQRMQQQQLLEEQRLKRKQQIQHELDQMSTRELLQYVMKTQQERVAAYRDYEKGLQVVLQTGNMTTYPETCSKATATFSVLSDTIRMVQETLLSARKKRPDLAKLLKQLQSHEKEKLHLTAAHHLERIRQRNNDMQLQQQQPEGSQNDETGASQDDRISQLLREGVASLQVKINTCVESINEVIEEIRCAILEEED